ncbi:glycosyltransferase [Candidatus Parcubacteria bacterium]|nr:glycosyltransferase [Candidatus Parcubacteria bacterium]
MNNNKPTISVLMPVYNGERYVAEAIESILSQTYSDFEFIIINDGSTDSTEKIIKSFNDSRIVYIDNGANLGLSKSFNLGIDRARGEFIARMDADDVSEPKRFERQVQFLKKRPHVGIVGSSMSLIDEDGRIRRVYRRQLDHMNIKFASLFSTPIMHPTIMGRTEVFKTHHYNEGLSNSEDYELWSRLLFESETHFANIREPLLRYRTYPHSFTQTLNLDKRVVSAHNSIRNMERYTKLSEREKRLIVRMRQEQNISLSDMFAATALYFRAARNFCRKEHLGKRKTFRIYIQVLPNLYFLAKYKLKRLLNR